MATSSSPRLFAAEAMETLNRNVGKRQQGDAADGEDGFKHKDESPKDGGGKDSVVDFFLNFLFQHGMTETLLCFQSEWHELVRRKGLVAAGRGGAVPDVYVENQRLDRELRNALREREEVRRAASAGPETLEWAQRARDLHRMQHKQDLQEVKRLSEGIKRLKAQCDAHGNKIKTMREKYLAAAKQVRLALDREKGAQETQETETRMSMSQEEALKDNVPSNKHQT
ncbi:sperm-associated antigen 16 protein-like [Kryptolebias marmoratus]|uniref:Sperm-associated antigen 16 protein-like n=1 Tax=Kryptolebias marmoratus TaxID=37003 RepID=A0A3Q3AV20_KRYMA|nr:sperm-associated antigen 16 protein-like [Kryptolebias marmoratus]